MRAERNLHTFAIVKGMPGSGKSHLIRWLYECYRVLAEDQVQGDVVILIERSSNNLRETLRQITRAVQDLKSDVFRQHRSRLENATTQLSEMGLADSLLNNLQVANREQIAEDLLQQLPSQLKQPDQMRLFLLDSIVRDELARKGGPIERIIKGLTSRQSSSDEAVLFQPDDFMFSDSLLSRLRYEGRRKVVELIQALAKGSANHREGMAAYLNELLRKFAIGKTIALTTGELRDIFFDIRRELRLEGRGLALFIEDITTFTGLDEGLMEVLVTQHTGDSPEFCRLLAVIGITDQYFKANLPDNIKQRATYQINLSETTARGTHTSVLSESMVQEMVARYLNALRLPVSVLESWRSARSTSAELPNACMECPVRPSCHNAFGTSAIEAGYEQHQIGLYPFNQNAIQRLFDGIEDQTLRTPRGLIQRIVQFILQGSSELIMDGQFPPSPTRLSTISKPPSFRNHLQLNLLRTLTPVDRDRLQTLVIYWGDQTLYSRGSGSGRTLGGLSATVFNAFNVSMIAGDEDDVSGYQIVAEKSVTAAFKPGFAAQIEPEAASSRLPNVLHTYIDAWRNGASLRKANDMSALLASFAKDYIDWDSYAIPSASVEDRAIASN